MKNDALFNLLPEEELLAQLAEERSEAAKAALKLRRARDGVNPTPVSEEEAFSNLVEELADIYLCSIVLFGGELDDDDPCNMCDDVGDTIVEIMEQKLPRRKWPVNAGEIPSMTRRQKRMLTDSEESLFGEPRSSTLTSHIGRMQFFTLWTFRSGCRCL